MNLTMSATFVRKQSNGATDGSERANAQELSLFEAVRLWSNEEGENCKVLVDGSPIKELKIREILHSAEFKAALLAFDERR